MQSSSPPRSIVEVLPEECLIAIVGALDYSFQSLYPLLRTCRTLLRLGAVVLYRSPFELIEQDERLDTQDRIARQRKLLRLLLSCLDETTLARLPPYQSNLVSLPRHPTIDYLALYSRHSSRNFDIALTPGSGSSSSSHNSSGGSSTNTPIGGPLLSVTAATTPIASLAEARRAVHLALLSHTPSHIRALTFSIRYMANLQPLATLLSTLSRIELYMPVKTPVEGAIHFIQTHRQAFPGMLDEIKLDVTSSVAHHSSSALIRLFQAMGRPRVIDVRGWPGAVQNLAQLPTEGCRVLLMRQGVMVNTVAAAAAAAPPPPQQQQQQQQQQGSQPDSGTAVPPSLSEIVSAMPKLETLRMTINAPNFFAWAGKQGGHGSCDSGRSRSGGSVSSSSDRVVCRPTQFLKHVRLEGFDRDLIPSLTDVARYYEGTLESIFVLSRFDLYLPQYLKETSVSFQQQQETDKTTTTTSTTSTTATMATTTTTASTVATDSDRLRWTWTLPRLHTLDLEGSIAIRFDYTSLQCCPGLTDLRVNVGRKIPQDWDPKLDALVYIVLLPRLRALDLAGYWGLTDRLVEEVLVPGLADRLQRLNLMWCQGPTDIGVEAVVRGIRTLRWLGLPSSTELERDKVLSIRKILQLDSLELAL
ncbi:hypothetical protein DFQ27_003661 [Actinomortierella ambigua]|uniref:Uncharacterized protein n=1 Tax=Actinomortierella ambigua TaxID=1343610 RepID=A0A9P6Q5S5_9FUNG|nr:hypothetical protein DFQ27_003661 [Actinomortierella ambigua]